MSRARTAVRRARRRPSRGWQLAGPMLVSGLGALAAGCGSGSGGGLLPGPAGVTLLDVQAQVFGPRCALSGCHTGTTAPFGLDLASVGTSAASLVGVASAEVPSLLRVEPFNATDSYLFMKLSADPRILGDAMPLIGPALNAADLALVESWIDQGAL